MLFTPSLIALYALAGLFAIFLWVRAFSFPRGKRRQAVHIAITFVVLMGVIVVVFSVLVPWAISLILRQPFTGSI